MVGQQNPKPSACSMMVTPSEQGSVGVSVGRVTPRIQDVLCRPQRAGHWGVLFLALWKKRMGPQSLRSTAHETFHAEVGVSQLGSL